MIDPTSLKKYRQTKGRLGSRLHNEIDWEEGAFRQYEKRCAFLNEENLCDLYIEGNGSGMFCRTAGDFPVFILSGSSKPDLGLRRAGPFSGGGKSGSGRDL